MTSYLGSKNSSQTTLDRAKALAEGIGATHFNMSIDEAYDAILKIFNSTTGKAP